MTNDHAGTKDTIGTSEGSEIISLELTVVGKKSCDYLVRWIIVKNDAPHIICVVHVYLLC